MKRAMKVFASLALMQLVVAKEPHNLSAANELAHFKLKNSAAYASNEYISPNYGASSKIQSHPEEKIKKPVPKIPDALTNTKDSLAKSKTPAGFEGIDNNYSGKATLFDNYTRMGAEDISYNEVDDSITLSKPAQQKIIKYYYNKLTKQGKIDLLNALKHTMPATTQLNKFYEARSDNKVTCHFNYNNLNLYILVPNKYLKNNTVQYKHNLNHPEPTFHTPSLKSSLYAYYDHYAGYNKMKWEANGSTASGRSSLIYSLNNTITGHVNDLYVEYHGKKYTYDVGYREPILTSVVSPYGNIWGVFLTENPKLINNKFYSSYKAPLTITVTKPYYVEIKYRGKTLYRGTLLQGENVIETSSFPLGTYNITISKRDLVTDQIEETTEVFSQQGSRYNWLYSGLQITAGLESDYFNSAFTDKTLYFHAKKGYNLFKGETDIFYTFANDTSYIGAEYDYISSTNLDYSVAASLSQKADVYFSAISSYTSGKSKYSANLYSGFANDFSSSRSKLAGLQYNYNRKDWSISAYGNYDFADSHSLSSTISKNFKLNDIPTNTYFTLQYDNSRSFTYLLGLSISFNIDKHIVSSTSLSHTSAYNDYSISNTTAYQNNENNLRLANTLYFGVDSDNYNLTTATYDTDTAKYAADLNIHQGDDGAGINTASVSMRTNFYLTPSAYLFSATNTDTAYIVKTPTLKDDTSTKFIVNDKIAMQGKTLLVPSYSFSYKKLEIVPDTMKYSLKKEQWNEFFYPNNIYTPETEIQKTCLVSFYADIPKEYNYTFAGMEDNFYGHGQQKTIAHMVDDTKLTYIYLNKEHEQCATNVVINCTKNKINLGKISCKETKE
jgi:hypothetical protein